MTATIKHLWRSPRRGQPMQSLQEVRAVPDSGLDSCAHGRRGSKRQVLLVSSEKLARFELQPGEIKENITTAGVAVDDLPAGALLRLGSEVVLCVTGPCEPCEKMDRIRPGLCDGLYGHRGALATVETGGLLRVGDTIEILSALSPTPLPLGERTG